MKKTSILQENIFATLTKMFAAFQVDRKIGTPMKELPNDPEVKEAVKNWEQSSRNAIKLLKDYCKRHPNDPKCKDSDGGK